MSNVKESDWRLFRTRLPLWQHAWLEKLEQGYIGLLEDKEKSPEERFWELEQRIRRDRLSPGIEATLSRSSMLQTLCQLLEEGVIAMEDLDGMSEELLDSVRRCFSVPGIPLG